MRACDGDLADRVAADAMTMVVDDRDIDIGHRVADRQRSLGDGRVLANEELANEAAFGRAKAVDQDAALIESLLEARHRPCGRK